jgi:hypothetical protein
MILVDYHQIVLANIMVAYKANPSMDCKFIRGMITRSLGSYRKQFAKDWGSFVLCDDSSKSWRGNYFQHYKLSRKLAKKKSSVDWDHLFPIIKKAKEEAAEELGMIHLKVPHCEGDDLIAVLVHQLSKQSPTEHILILSSDKDMIQLHKYSNVKQFDPRSKQWIAVDDPNRHLMLLILQGDRVDGIPNVLSEDDVFAIPGKRQVPLREKAINELISSTDMPMNIQKNFIRNRMLIDFDMIPNEHKENIWQEFSSLKNRILPNTVAEQLNLF